MRSLRCWSRTTPRSLSRGSRRWLDRAAHIVALLDAASEPNREARAGPAGARTSRDADARWIAHPRALPAALSRRRPRTWSDHRQPNQRPTPAFDVSTFLPDPARRAPRPRHATQRPDDVVFCSAAGAACDNDSVRPRPRADDRVCVGFGWSNEQRTRCPRLTLHGSRHTLASLVVALNEDPRYVMSQLRHTDPVFTVRLQSEELCGRPSVRTASDARCITCADLRGPARTCVHTTS
jgi:hypothetical protein